MDLVSHHVSKCASPAEPAEAWRAALDGSIKIASDHWIDRAMNSVTVFGGTGFLGRRIVHHLFETRAMLRVASRHLGKAEGDKVKQIAADAHYNYHRARPQRLAGRTVLPLVPQAGRLRARRATRK